MKSKQISKEKIIFENVLIKYLKVYKNILIVFGESTKIKIYNRKSLLKLKSFDQKNYENGWIVGEYFVASYSGELYFYYLKNFKLNFSINTLQRNISTPMIGFYEFIKQVDIFDDILVVLFTGSIKVFNLKFSKFFLKKKKVKIFKYQKKIRIKYKKYKFSKFTI